MVATGLLISLLLLGMWASVHLKKLTVLGALTGGVIAVLLYGATGFTGVAQMGAFFILGTACTAWRSDLKKSRGLAEETEGRRTAGQVLANAGLCGLLALTAIMLPAETPFLGLLIATGFASATADTVSSELGNVYGRHFYNIKTGKRDVRGLNGVISLEGTLLGMTGSAVIVAIHAIQTGWQPALLLILAGGTVGNLADSFLGATLERNGRLTNNAVNFLNTCIAVAFTAIVYFLCLLFKIPMP